MNPFDTVNYNNKTKDQLIEELTVLHQKLDECQTAEVLNAREENRLLQSLILEINESVTLNDAFLAVLKNICAHTGWIYGETWALNQEKTSMVCSPSWFSTNPGLSTFYDLSSGMSFARGKGLPGRVWESKKTIWIKDITQDPEYLRADSADKAGLKTALGIPVLAKEEVVAVMIFYTVDALEENHRFVKLISVIAAQLGMYFLHKKSEENLIAASAYARSLIEASLDPLMTISPDGRIMDVNQATETFTGIQRKDLIGSDFPSYFADPEKAREGYQRSFSEGILMNYMLVMRHISGREVPVLYNATIYKDNQGSIQGVFAAMRDISEREKALKSLKASEEHYRSLIESSQDCICHISLSGKFIDMNSAGVLLNELEGPDDVIGRDCTESIIENRIAAEDALEKASAGETVAIQYKSLSKKGKEIWWDSKVTPIRDHNGRINGLLRISRDITERKKSEDVLKEAHARLIESTAKIKEADRLKTEIMSTMSHELRTPLNAIIGFSELLSDEIDGAVNDLQRKDLNYIHESGERLLNIINDVLDLASIEVDGMDLKREVVDVSELIGELVPDATSFIKGKDIRLIVNTAGAGINLNADPNRFRQIMINLLSNAAKFTESGEIEIKARRASEGSVVISVRDTGIGIREDDIPKVFEMFRQIDMSNTRNKGGTGLGMAIVKRLVEMHGGSVRVESRIGTGTTFFVTLPEYNG